MHFLWVRCVRVALVSIFFVVSVVLAAAELARDRELGRRWGRSIALGFIALPNVWIFQIFFPLISPAMDLMFLWTMFSAALERYQHPDGYAFTNLKRTLFYYALFLAAEWLSRCRSRRCCTIGGSASLMAKTGALAPSTRWAWSTRPARGT